MSGTPEGQGEDLPTHELSLISVLDRQTAVGALDALVNALSPAIDTIPVGEIAIGFDSSVFLRLGGHRSGADIIDYLSSRHSAPLILPGQAIQEFWNNQLQAVPTVAANLRKTFLVLKDDVSKIDSTFGGYAQRFIQLLDEFNSDYGHLYDEATFRKTLGFLEMLRSRATTPYASRQKFQTIATHRKQTKTPPGFRDEGDGDFYIWVDFLTGLQHARAETRDFAKAVLVSQDRKLDWVRQGTAHPILVAEVRALFNVPFEVWNLERLSEEVAKAT